jgi:hypothetical protein
MTESDQTITRNRHTDLREKLSDPTQDIQCTLVSLSLDKQDDSSQHYGTYMIHFKITGKILFFFLAFRSDKTCSTTISMLPRGDGEGCILYGEWFRPTVPNINMNADCIQAMESFNHIAEGELDNQHGDLFKKCAWRIILCRSILFP